MTILLTKLNLTNEQVPKLLEEIEIYAFRAKPKMKWPKAEMGLTKKHKSRIHDGRVLLPEIQYCIRCFKVKHFEKRLDGVWDLSQKKLQFKSVTFTTNHKTLWQLRKESIRKKPEKLIKRLKSRGGDTENRLKIETINWTLIQGKFVNQIKSKIYHPDRI